MNDFNKICEIIESMTPVERIQFFHLKSIKLLDLFLDVTNGDPERKQDVIDIYIAFLFAAAGSDGKLQTEEYELLKPIIDNRHGADFSYDQANEAFIHADGNSKELKDALKKIISELSSTAPEVATDMIAVALIISAADGNVSFREKRFIKQLME